MSRYQDIADAVARDIAAGLLLPGARLPSLRRLCEREGISLMTALAAYRRLEALRLVAAQPRSGYCVAQRAAEQVRRPAIAYARTRSARNGRASTVHAVLEAANDPSLFPLGLGCPDPRLFPQASLRRVTSRALAADSGLWTRYSLPPGDLPLRTAIARRLSARAARVLPEQVLITSGATEALSLAIRSLVQPGECVAIECPTFFGILDALQAHGVEVLELPSDPQHGLDPAELDKACKQRRVHAAVLMPSFANPTGSLMSSERKHALADVLRRRRVALIEDDVYAELAFDRRGLSPLFAERTRDQRAPFVLAGSFSKSLLPAGRIGYLVAEEPWLDRLMDAKRVSTLANNALAERVVATCLEDGLFDRHLRRLAPQLSEGVTQLVHAVAQHFPTGTRVSQPRGGFMVWVELPRGADGERLFWDAREAGVAIVPGSLFSLSRGLERYVRLSGGCAEGAGEAVAKLGHLVSAQLS
jgi:DNA-binding transcriptional MocR family regulator